MNKYRIGFFTFVILSFLILGAAYYYSSVYMIDYFKTENAKELPEEIIVEADGKIIKNDCFYLMEQNDYIVVFQSDRKTIYEYTDILYHELPVILQKEIKNGKYIADLEELYGFLENYSS